MLDDLTDLVWPHVGKRELEFGPVKVSNMRAVQLRITTRGGLQVLEAKVAPLGFENNAEKADMRVKGEPGKPWNTLVPLVHR